MPVQASCLGHPRIGAARELKKALERFWAGRSTADEMEVEAASLRRRHWQAMRAAGLDHIPSGDFSLYDHVLDMAVTLGAVPERYRAIADRRGRYFAMARGLQDARNGVDVKALEMTKWFDTNYHYLVPELETEQRFALDPSRLLAQIAEARALGIEPRPVVLGPVSFLMLSKHVADRGEPLDLLGRLLTTYEELLTVLAAEGVTWLQLDEPCLVLDLTDSARVAYAYEQALGALALHAARPRILVTTYFESVAENLDLVVRSGCDGLHVDLCRAPGQLGAVLDGLPSHMTLSVGVVDGRNVWRADLDRAHGLVRRAVEVLGPDRVMVAPSCSLLHVPMDLAGETRLDEGLRSWLAFGAQKLLEVRALADAAEEETPDGPAFAEARAALENRRTSPLTRDRGVRERNAAVEDRMLRRTSSFDVRSRAQQARLGLPAFPTTTIGSFPQTEDVRRARADWRAGRIGESAYQTYLEAETRRCVERQEAIGLDVLVHGEFERNDMVEYFAEQLAGFAVTENGWVQSYGSRCVKPPLLFGDVGRPRAMTVGWSRFAQSLTTRPMKGMITGPVTIMKWSFVRDDQPNSETCKQVALALREEVADLEAAGLAVVQVDEPAIREGLPLRRADRPAYLRWAVDSFRLATSGVRDETQIHTHMCYSEFGDILEAIAAMDADVLSVEASRSRMELLDDFWRARYPNEVGPGVYDIHSPRVPSVSEIFDLLRRAAAVVPASRLWVNPDCGLKTRGWPEVEAALTAMVEAARLARTQLATEHGRPTVPNP